MDRWIRSFVAPALVLLTVPLEAAVAESDGESGIEPEAGGRVEIEVRGLDAEDLATLDLDFVATISGSKGGDRIQRELQLDSTGFATTEVDHDGMWTVALKAVSPTGGGFFVDSREISVSAGDLSQVRFDLGEKIYVGRLSRHGNPVSARLRLDAKEDPALAPVNALTRQDGSFVAIIPRPGHYDVSIYDSEEKVSTVVANVPFVDPNEKVEISLPSSGIGGEVLDRSGTGVSSATVRAVRAPGSQQVESEERSLLTASARTDGGGRFVLDGVMPGRWELRARQGELRSDPVSVTIQTDEVRSDVTLVLEEGLMLHGRVSTSSGNPVPYVRGILFVAPQGPAEEIARPLLFETDSDGQFDLVSDRVKADFAYVNVFPEDLPVTAQRFPMSKAREMQITVPEQSSELRLILKGLQGQSMNPHLFMLVAQDGARVGLGSLSAFEAAVLRQQNGATEIHIPRLTPGRWQVVEFSTLADGLPAVGKDPSELPVVAEFDLRPAETKSLELRLSDKK